MSYKPQGFTKFIAWASIVVGLYYLAAPVYGVLYLVAQGAASKAFPYVLPVCLGIVVLVAGITLLKGLRSSRYIYLVLSIFSVVPLVRFAPTLLVLFNGVSDPAAKASLLFIASMAIYSATWVIVSTAITFVVFRHFRKQPIEVAPTLEELTQVGVGSNNSSKPMPLRGTA